MKNSKKFANNAKRQVLASRIRELRANKGVWRPTAPRADLQCRRGEQEKELSTVKQPVFLSELLELAKQHGFSDLYEVRVKSEPQTVPYEDFHIDVIVLTTFERLSDDEYFDRIAVLWNEYQKAIYREKGQSKQYEQYLNLKAIFEHTA